MSIDPGTLAASLQLYSEGSNSRRAAVGLLVGHDYWITRIAHHHPEFIQTDESGNAWNLRWRALSEAVKEGRFTASRSQFAILDIALSLQVPDHEIRLGDCVLGLGDVHLRLILHAIATANGRPTVI